MTWLFVQKEWRTLWRTARGWLVLAVFAIFGILAPLTARVMPTIVEWSTGNAAIVDLLPKPDSVASWTQYFKNMTQMGLYILAILFGATVSQELRANTLVNLVTKGLPRSAVIVAKYLLALGTWVAAMSLAWGITWAYTVYYFPDDHSPHSGLGLLALLVFGVFFMAVVVLGSTLSRHSFGGLLVAVLTMAVLSALNLIKAVRRFNPVSLTSENLKLVQGRMTLNHLAPALWLAVGGGLVLVALAVWVLNRQKL